MNKKVQDWAAGSSALTFIQIQSKFNSECEVDTNITIKRKR